MMKVRERYHLRDGHGRGGHGVGGVSPVGAGAHGLGLPAASSCRLLLHQLTPLELRPGTAQDTGEKSAEPRPPGRPPAAAGHSLFRWRPPKLKV